MRHLRKHRSRGDDGLVVGWIVQRSKLGKRENTLSNDVRNHRWFDELATALNNAVPDRRNTQTINVLTGSRKRFDHRRKTRRVIGHSDLKLTQHLAAAASMYHVPQRFTNAFNETRGESLVGVSVEQLVLN
jgi:hypothetical protein